MMIDAKINTVSGQRGVAEYIPHRCQDGDGMHPCFIFCFVFFNLHSLQVTVNLRKS